MDKTVEKIKSMADYFVNDCSEFYNEMNGDEIVGDYRWSDDYIIKNGASKMVLVPTDDKLDFVVKMPFNGYLEGDTDIGYCCEASDEQYENAYCEGEYCNCCYESCPFYNAEKGTYKNEFSGGDYCKIECDVYEKAEEEGLAELFAKTEYIYTTESGVKVYKQKKVKCPDDYTDKEFSDKTNETYNSISSNYNYKVFSESFTKAIIEYYGFDTFKKLADFIDDNGLDDFHSANVGYGEKGEPILFDYSGYES